MKKIEKNKKNEKKSCGTIHNFFVPRCWCEVLSEEVTGQAPKYFKGIQIVKNIFFQFFIMSSYAMDTSANTPNPKNGNLYVSRWANFSPVTALKSEIQLFLDFLCICRLVFVRRNTCLITLCKAYYEVFLNQINLVFFIGCRTPKLSY